MSYPEDQQRADMALVLSTLALIVELAAKDFALGSTVREAAASASNVLIARVTELIEGSA